MSGSTSIKLNSVWLFGFISLASGILLSLANNRLLASLGFTIGSTVLIACVAGAKLLSAAWSRPWPRRQLSVVTLSSLLFLLCGLTWMIPAQLSSQDGLQPRNASVLLLAGGAMLTLSQFHAASTGRSSSQVQTWLPAAIIAVVAVWLAVFALSRSELVNVNRESLSWGLASLVGILGLTAIIAMTIGLTITTSKRATSPMRRHYRIGWCLAGSGFLLQGLSLIREPRPHAAWWLPLLALGVLLAATRPASEGGALPAIQHNVWLQYPRGTALAGMAVTACISAAVLVSLIQGSPSPADWALIAAAGSMLVLSSLTVGVSAMMFQTHIFVLVRRVSVLSRLSQTDPLTRIANRRSTDERLAAEIQRAARFGHPLSIALIDVDDFKLVNDTYGHPVGDAVLQRLASLLVRELRTIDVAGRYGGEEFLVVLPETDAGGASIALERILEAVRGDRQLSITVSAGISEFETNGRAASDLLDAADRALYQAKRSGKNRAVVAGDGE